ncbi:GNAT family N-acetyltransferase [Hwanghaeella grinnelliae]|uniref:GNAT family N-acetyltransferase n=1 Tax=Hwanghaeella grinnelliae TaxID=2500179 RepID=A0A437QZF3_9PROT|nr:GNAT family N-acetyltransferase [Hwanghaeella grinnelliae]
MMRKAAAGDLDGIRACAAASYAMYIPRIGRKPAPMVADFDTHLARGELFVAESGGAVAGYVVQYRRGDHLHVENVAVDPVYQGRGIGRSLLDFAEQAALAQGLSAIELYTNAKMTENLALYPRLGYEETARGTEDGFDRVFFRKALRAKP